MNAKARILVVDDERSMREFLEIFFRREGYDVVTAGDVDGALVYIENDDFDVVITDIQMPKGSGLDVLHAVEIEQDVQPFRRFAPGPAAVHELPPDDQRREGTEDMSANGGVGGMIDGAGPQQ